MTEAAPIACTLAPGAFKDRIAWINALARDALRSHERRDLVLELNYAPEARDRVREMVRNEQECCSFLNFVLREEPDQIRLIITAPEAAREAADALFQQFVPMAPTQSACACAVSSPDAANDAVKQPGAKAAGLTAITLATGAVACGACCVIPFALPPRPSLEPAASSRCWPTRMHRLPFWRSSRSWVLGAGSHGRQPGHDASPLHPPFM